MSEPNRESLPLGRWRRIAFATGLLAAAVGAVGAAVDVERFYQSYLMAFLYWWTASMGCLALSLLYQMTGGRWGDAARPFLDAGICTLPLVVVGFIPVVLGLDEIYAWRREGFFADVPHAANRRWWFTASFFYGRSAAYLAIPLVLGFLVTRAPVRGGTGAPAPRRLPGVGGLGTVLVALVVTFAATDWAMSLSPRWTSSLYGGIFAAGGLLTAMCLVTAGVALSAQRLGRNDEDSISILHDCGKLLLALLMLWAYLAFSQFLIIYSGNLPEEIQWYERRLRGGWGWVAAAIVLLHFVVPLFCLLSRRVKRQPRVLASVAVGLALVRLVETYWVVLPSFETGGFSLHFLDVVVPIALGGIWGGVFLRQLHLRLGPVVPYWPHAKVHAKPTGSY